MLIVNDASACGLSTFYANAASAFSVVHHGCATGTYGFAHELGHVFGALHDPSENNPAFPYGHGFRHPNNTMRTLMALNCTPSCQHVNFWSNPNIVSGGIPMGSFDRQDNHRVLNERRSAVAAFR